MPSPHEIIRVVRIGDFDKSACCGAHVASTGRIGVIRIFDLESKKEGTRASFLAGARALERSQAETSILRELRKLAGCATADLPATFQKGLERSRELGKEVERIWSLRLSDLARSAETMTVGSSRLGLYVGELPRELTAILAGMIAEATGGGGWSSATPISRSAPRPSTPGLFSRGFKASSAAKAADRPSRRMAGSTGL